MQPVAPTGAGKWTAQRVVLTTLGAVLVGLGFWLVFRFYNVAFILFTALVLGTVIRPAVDWLYRRGLRRDAGVILVYLTLLGLLVGFVLLLAPLLIEQAKGIIAKLPAYYLGLHAELVGSSSALIQRLAQQLPPELALSLPGQAGGGLGLGVVGQALSYVGVIWRLLFVGTAILVLAFYWTLDGDRMVRSAMLHFPIARHEEWHDLIAEMETKVGAYVRGLSVLSLVVGVMATIAYMVIGLPSPLVLGLLAGVFEAVPIIGPILGAVLPGMLALSVDPSKLIWVVVATIVIQQLEGHFLVPRVMNKAVGVSPIVTILAIMAFSTLFGLPGAVLAIPLAALIQIVLNYGVMQREAAHRQQPAGRDRASVLRYRARDLVQDVRSQMRYKQDAADVEGDQIEDLVEVAALNLEGLLAQARSGGDGVNKTLGYFALVLATLTGVFLLWQFRSVVLLFVFALALAAAMRRPIDYLASRRLPRGLAVTLTYLIALALLGGLLFLLSDALIAEGQAASRGFAAAWEQFRTAWPAGSPLQQFIAQQIPQPEEMYLAVQGAVNLQLVETGLGVTLGLVGAFSQFMLVLVLSIYWSIDRDRFERLWLSMLQADRRIRARAVWQGIEEGVGAYLRSTALQFVVSGVLLALGYRLLGLEAPVTVALLAAVIALIPLLGWALAIIPATLVGLIAGPAVGALAAGYTLVVLLILKREVAPRLLDHRRYNPMLAVLMMLVLTNVLGILGLLLAVPLAAVIQIVVSEFLAPSAVTAATVPAGAMHVEQYMAQMATIQGAVAAANGRLSPIQTSLVERLNRLTGEAASLIELSGDIHVES